MIVYIVAISVLLINIPFGYWRKKEKRFSLNWFLSIHIPVAISIFLRYIFHIEFRWGYLGIFVLMFVLGQYTGKFIHSYRNKSKTLKV